MFEVNEVVVLKKAHLYWVLQGSHTLNAVVDQSKSDECEQIVRARVLKVQYAPRWGNLLFLAVEGEDPPPDSAFVALNRYCERCS